MGGLIDRTCGYCGGHGRVLVAGATRTCPTCHGTGMQDYGLDRPAPRVEPVVLPVAPEVPPRRTLPRPGPWIEPRPWRPGDEPGHPIWLGTRPHMWCLGGFW